ncbi:UNVERIFIED_CONTAM: hypothetical protein FKN15_046189 [Acipenser sinensis]
MDNASLLLYYEGTLNVFCLFFSCLVKTTNNFPMVYTTSLQKDEDLFGYC